MRSTKGGNWVFFDKNFSQEFKNIRGREFSKIEAGFSFAIDVDCGNKWTISGYSELWGWTRNRVRRFVNSLLSEGGHLADRKRTGSGHPMHLLYGENSAQIDRKRTGSGQEADTTKEPKPKPKPKEKEPVLQEKAEPHITYKKIIDYLNEKTGSKFKSTTQSTKRLIKARFNEGFTENDFYSVIDTKVDEWNTDEKMVIYLRPKTLFGTNFEGYLQASSNGEGGKKNDPEQAEYMKNRIKELDKQSQDRRQTNV